MSKEDDQSETQPRSYRQTANRSIARDFLSVDIDLNRETNSNRHNMTTSIANRYNDFIWQFRQEEDQDEDDDDHDQEDSDDEEEDQRKDDESTHSSRSRWEELEARKTYAVDQTINLMDAEANQYSTDNFHSSLPGKMPETTTQIDRPIKLGLFRGLLLILLATVILAATYSTTLKAGGATVQTNTKSPTTSPTTRPLPATATATASESTDLPAPAPLLSDPYPVSETVNITDMLLGTSTPYKIDTNATYARKAIQWMELDASKTNSTHEYYANEAAFLQRYFLAAVFFSTHPMATPKEPNPSKEDGYNQRQRLRVLQLTNAPNSKHPWMTLGTSVCDWVGIECDELDKQKLHRPVLILNLSNTNLQGSLPPEFAMHLEHQTSLLQIDLSSNRLSGPLPDFTPEKEPKLSSQLEFFHLQNNHLSGQIPQAYLSFPQLYEVDFSNNQFVGTIPLTTKLSHLRKLEFHDNQLMGSLPSPALTPELIDLRLQNNHLQGSIPSTIGKLSKLDLLSLGNNNFSGTIPDKIWKDMNQLRHLDLHKNQFTGTLGDGLAMLPELQELLLDQNLFTGTIPSDWNATRLQGLVLTSNQLTGTIPSSIGKLTMLKELWLSDNNLQGNLPSELGNLFRLERAQLQDNQLKGAFPSTVIQRLRNLDSLEIYNTELTGSVSAEVCEMKHQYNLKVISLDCQWRIQCKCCNECF